MNRFRTESSRWSAVVSRNSSANGCFVYCVKTTQIYCRPICKARLARRANVEFHHTAKEAETAGYRACKRCRPNLERYDPHSEVVAKAQQTIERADPKARPTLKALAAEANLSEWHFHRIFTSVAGVTPKGYSKGLSQVSSSLPTPSLTYANTPASNTALSDALTPSIIPTNEDFEASFDHGNDILSNEIMFGQDWNLTEAANYDPTVSDFCGTVLFPPVKEIVYTIQPWISVLLLIAITKDGICALDTGQSEDELSNMLKSMFPFSPIILSNWNGDCTGTKIPGSHHHTFATVMQALLNPSEKTLDLEFDVRI